MARLVFAGEAIVDIVMRVPRLPERGGDVLATGSTVTAGGGFNVMAAAARQGLPVSYAGGHGTGPWGDLVRAALAAEGIGLLRDADPGRDTGFDVALVDDDGERTFVTHLGAEAVTAPGGWDATPLEPGDFVYISGYGLVSPESGSLLANWAAALGGGVMLFVDPGPLASDIPGVLLGQVLARCDWLSCNRREAALLSGAGDPVEAARRLRDRLTRPAVSEVPAGAGATSGVLVRGGPQGCLLARRVAEMAAKAISRIPAPAVTVVDTTGAGDTHSGVFLAGLADGLSPARAARRANAAAALSVTRPGPATSPTRAELDAWLPDA